MERHCVGGRATSFHPFGAGTRGDVEVGGVWVILVILLLLPALIYGAGIQTKWGIVSIGLLLLLATARTWLTFNASDPYDPFDGLIPFARLIPAVGIVLLGSLADLSYRFFRESPVR